jgi:gliding motility-associated-like protein
MQVRKLLLLCFAVISSLGFSQFQFNEYSCANISTVLDPLGVGNQQRPSWIELINNSSSVQTLTGWSIGTDRNGNNNKFPIPFYQSNAINVDSFGLQVIYLCTHDSTRPGTIGTQTVDIHANFQIYQTKSPTLYLFSPTAGNAPVDSVVIQRLLPGNAWGKPNSDSAAYYSDTTGGCVGFGLDAWRLYQVGSPGKKNVNDYHAAGAVWQTWPNNYFLGYTPTPKLVTKPGYYGSNLQVTIQDSTPAVMMNTIMDGVINIKDSLEIFATTDCTNPTTYSANATIPANINVADLGHLGSYSPLTVPYYNTGAPTPAPNLVGVVVRAVMHDQSIRPNYLDGFEAYGAYIINDSTYHMGVTCFCMDTAKLFSSPMPPQINDTAGTPSDSYSTLYCYISNSTKKQVYKNQGQALVNRIDFTGFLNTATPAKLQWNFQFRSEDRYGYSYSNVFDFFTDQSLGLTNRPDFPELIFRSSAEDNFLKGGYNAVQGHGATHLRDFFNHTLTLRHKLDFESSHYTPTYLFINGINRGIYYIKEPIDTMYTNYYYNYAQADIIACDLAPTTTTPRIAALAGSLPKWNNFYSWAMNNTAAGFQIHNPASYQMFSDSLDIQSFIDYNFYNMFSVNTNFVKNQALWWRGISNDTTSSPKWRFGLSNTDMTWGSNHNNSGVNGTNTSAPCNYISGYGANFQHPLMPLFAKLMLNDTFQSAFYARYQDLLNTSYSCDSITTHLAYVKSLLTKDIASQVYWNISPTASASGDSTKLWTTFVDSVNAFITERCSLALQSMAANCLNNADGPYNLCVSVIPANGGHVNLNSLTLTTFTWNGQYVDSVNYTASAVPDSNYVFDHWQTPYSVQPVNTSDTVTFKVNQNACLTAVFVLKPPYETYGTPMLPEAFSPNGDGINDVLNVYGIGGASSYTFEIFNRWGERLFYSTDKTQGWDGTYPNGSGPAAVGVYAYRYDIIINNKTYVKNGSVTLLR